MDIITRYMISIVGVTFLFLFLFVISQPQGGFRTALRSMLSVGVTDGIMFCLLNAFLILQIISYKIQGWYEGLYSYNTKIYNDESRDIFDYNNKDAFPLPMGYIPPKKDAVKTNPFSGTQLGIEIPELGSLDPTNSLRDNIESAITLEIETTNSLITQYTTKLADASNEVEASNEERHDVYDGLKELFEDDNTFYSQSDAGVSHDITDDKYPIPTQEILAQVRKVVSNAILTEIIAQSNLRIPGVPSTTLLNTVSKFTTKTDSNPLTDYSWLLDDDVPEWLEPVTVSEDKKTIRINSLKRLTKGIYNLEISLLCIIFSLFVFKNYPVKMSTMPGETGQPVLTIRIAVLFLGVLLGSAYMYAFWKVFEPISSQIVVDSKNQLKRQISIIETDGKDEEGSKIDLGSTRYYMPKTDSQLLPPSKDFKYLLLMLSTFIAISVGLCFGVLTTNMASNSYEIMKVKSAFISDLSNEGRLVAYELQDPLFKLIDHTIAKKTEEIQEGDVKNFNSETGQYELRTRLDNKMPSDKEPGIKIFDFVKKKKLSSLPNKKARSSKNNSIDGDQVYLVAAINGWTILPEISGKKFLYLNQSGKKQDSYTDEEGLTSKLKMRDDQINKFNYALSDKEYAEMVKNTASVPYEFNPYEAKKNIYGGVNWETYPEYMSISDDKTTPSVRNRGTVNPKSELTLIPIDITEFSLSVAKGDKIIKPAMEFITDLLRDTKFYNNQLLKQRLEDITDPAVRNEAADLFRMVQNIIKTEFSYKINNEDPLQDEEPPPIAAANEDTGLLSPIVFNNTVVNDNTSDMTNKQFINTIAENDASLAEKLDIVIRQNYINNRIGVKGRLYNDLNSDGEVVTEPLINSGEDLGFSIGVKSKAKILKGKHGDYKVLRRIKQNIDLDDLSALDLIDLRYGIVRDIALSNETSKVPTITQRKFSNKSISSSQGYEMDKRQLLEQLLPQIKNDASDEALYEYNKAIGYSGESRLIPPEQVRAEISLFENRFNSNLMQQKNIAGNRKPGNSIETGTIGINSSIEDLEYV